MDAAALSLKIDSSSVVQAANDLDRFSASSEKAAKAAGLQSGSIAKLVASAQSMDRKLSEIVSGLDKVNAALASNARASQGAAAANDNVAKAIGNADSHVVAYREHLEGLAAAQKASTATGMAADAHVIAYTQHLASLARAQQDANAHVLAWRNNVAGTAAPQVQLNAHVEAYRKHLASLPPAMDKATASASALQANTGNIAAQFQDIGVTAAMGMNPLIIGLQQGTQLSAVFAQSGGTMRDVLVGAFKQIASAQALLTIGMVALVAVAIQLAMAWYNSESEAEKLAKRIESIKTASDGVSDAQGILGRVFDLTTGKMKTQTAAAVNLARAQLLLMKATAQSNISKAAKELDGSSELGFGGRLKAWLSGDRGLIEGSARVEALTKALKNNQITGAQAMQGLQMLADNGQITNEMFLKGSAAAANYGVEIENVKTATQALADLERGRLSGTFTSRGGGGRGPRTAAPRRAPQASPAREPFTPSAYEPSSLLTDAAEITSYQARMPQSFFPDIDAYFDKLTERVQEARGVAKGFFTDWINGAREGQNIFKSFGDSILNSFNRIIDKMLSNALTTAVGSMFQGSGGFLGKLLGGATPNALGGVYGSPQRFANGAAFTNSIVTSPTLFRFANGAALGEMGEAGPEAIMPLKRGPNGALGVEMHGGGRPVIRMGDYNPSYSFAGAVGLDGIASMVREGGAATYDQIKRDLQSLLQQLDTDGAFSS